MNKTHYLYCQTEDSVILISDKPPTPEEMRNIEDGILRVIKIEGEAVELDDRGHWVALEKYIPTPEE